MLAILKAKAYRAIVPLDFALFVKQRPDCEHSGNPSKCEIAELVRNLRLWSSYRARVDLLKCVHFDGEEYGILGMVFGKPPSFRETRGFSTDVFCPSCEPQDSTTGSGVGIELPSMAQRRVRLTSCPYID